MLVYYACKEITLGRGDVVAAGQPVPSASAWPHHILRAHLSNGWLEAREEEEPEVQSLDCPRCPGKTFKSNAGLQKHIASHDKRK